MTERALTDIAAKLQKIDFCMMSTTGVGQTISSRPMSNNGEVEYDGDNWFFSYRDTAKVSDILRNQGVSLSFTEPPSLLGKPGLFISIEGSATLVEDKTAFQQHWTSDLDRWFPEGVDTEGLVLIKVHADRIHYWDGEDNGTIDVR